MTTTTPPPSASQAQASTSTGTPGPRPLVAALFVAVGVACMTPWANSPIALAAGMALALAGLTAFPAQGKKLSRLLIQVCVITLGLRVDLRQLYEAASEGLVFAAATIVGAFALGLLLGKLLKGGKEESVLVCAGTAICGGSAIAAVGASIRASASAMAVATGAIFLLNAAALYLFPLIGHALHMSDEQFGTWAGVAIHDVSSVVGAASGYHAGDPASTAALDTANIVKLSRVIWILPVAFFAAWWMAREKASEKTSGTGEAQSVKAKAPVPWFVLFFLVASAVRTFVPQIGAYAGEVKFFAGLGFQGALFLIGAGLSRKAIASVGWRTLVQAVVLWLAMAGASLLVVLKTVD